MVENTSKLSFEYTEALKFTIINETSFKIFDTLHTYIHTYISYHFGGSIYMTLVRRRETSTSTNRVDTDTTQ
jgi:hypothetical protein